MSILFLICLVLFAVNCGKIKQPHDREKNMVRCTRRFNPGSCDEPVVPVWTYQYNLQNCTERLGCGKSSRSNRFSSHKRCMQTCRTLADLYGQLLILESTNDTKLRMLRMGPDDITEDPPNPEDYEQTYSKSRKHLQDPPLKTLTFAGIDERELDFLPPDIDTAGRYVAGDPHNMFHVLDLD